MRHLLIIGSFMAYFAFISASYAADDSACTPVSFKKSDDNIILLTNPPPKASQVIFFKNIGEKSVFVDHPTNGRGMGAGWSSYLRPGHWSALALNKENFTVHCSTIEPGKVIALDCAENIFICTPKNPSSRSTLKGNYWLTEDKPWDTFVNALGKRGFTFLKVVVEEKDPPQD